MKTAVSVTLAAAGLFLATLFVGCGRNLEMDYDHAELYTAGNARIAAPVRSVDIDWVSGRVDIVATDDSCLVVEEAAEGPLSDTTALHWYLDGEGGLHIQFAAAGRSSYRKAENLEKHLTVRVPRRLRLDEIGLDFVAAEVVLHDVSSNSLSVDMVSGSVDASFEAMPREMDFDLVSGTVTLRVPEGAGFAVDHDGVSSELTVEVPVCKVDGKTVSGDGACEIDLDCVSGQLFVKNR